MSEIRTFIAREIRTFIVPGEVRGKMRPKASSFGGHAKVYTPSKQIEYENWASRRNFCLRFRNMLFSREFWKNRLF